MPRPNKVIDLGKMSLEEALRALCKKHGCEFLTIRATGRCAIEMTFKDSRGVYLPMLLHTKIEGNIDIIDDGLYESAERLLAHSYPLLVKP